MKKLLLTAAIAVFGFTAANAQGFKAGANVGYTIGDAGDAYGLQVGADLGYTWSISENIELGGMTGYLRYFGEDMEMSQGGATIEAEGVDAGFVPIAVTGAIKFGEVWFAGADLGYAVYVGEDEGEGGFYYQPKFGYQNEMFEVYAFYKGISISETETTSSVGDMDVTVSAGGVSMASVGVGAAFKF